MGTLKFVLCWGNWYATSGASGGAINFPIVPNDGIELSSETSNQTYEGLNGPMLLLGRHNLKQWAIQSFFPAKEKQYKFLNVDGGVIKRVPVDEEKMTRPGANHAYGARHYTTQVLKDGMDIINELEEIRTQMIPMRAIYTMNGKEVFNLPCTITSLSWGRDQAGDIQYSMSFQEYVFPSYDATQLGELEEPVDAVETENKECDPSVFQTSSEASSSGGSGYERVGDANYTDNDVLMMCRHIVSGMTCAQSVYYYNDSDHKIKKSMTGSYTRAITAETLTSAEVWCVLNYCDKLYPDKSLSETLPLIFNNVIFDYSEAQYNKYSSFSSVWYGLNLEDVVKTVLDQWSDYHNNGANITRTLPATYYSQWGSVANSGAATGPKNYANSMSEALVYYFEDSLYSTANKPWYATAQSWIKAGKSWDFSVAY